MVFDVMIREGYNTLNLQIANVYRVHGSMLGQYIRDVQDSGKYIISIIPLYPMKKERNEDQQRAVGDMLGDISEEEIKRNWTSI